MALIPTRGGLWRVQFGVLANAAGHEQAKERPALVVSADFVNRSAAGMVIVLPLSRTHQAVRSHVHITPPEGGVSEPSDIQCEQIRTVSTQRLVRPLGAMSDDTMEQVERILKLLLDLT